jgi:hypothetical protein
MSDEPGPIYDAEYFRRKGFTEHPDGWRPKAYPLEPGYTLDQLQQYERIGREIESRMAKWPRRRSRRWRPVD